MAEVRHAMETNAPHCDLPQNDGVALLAISDLAQVEVVLESGTANGRSTELMARFLKAQITTVVPWRAAGGVAQLRTSARSTEAAVRTAWRRRTSG